MTSAAEIPASREERVAPGDPVSRVAPAVATALLGGLALVKLALHLAVAGVYGFFIDELYFLSCGEHLAWGYVDMPPLTAFQAWLTRALFGDSAYSIRLFPALAGAALVVMAGLLAREMGGGRFAQGLAALSILAAPVSLAFCSYLSMNSVEPVIWMGCTLLLMRMIRTGNTRLWIGIGLLSGLGLLNKHTMLLFGFALVVGLLLSAERGLLKSRWLLVGGALAFAIELPNLVWMIGHHFPMLELLANIRRYGRDVNLTFWQFWSWELLSFNPVSAPLWMLGAGGLLVARSLRPFRALGWAFLITLGVLLASPGSHKTYYVAPAFGLVLAAGAVLIERALRSPRLVPVRIAYAATIALVGALIAPMAAPILPAETYLRYAAALRVNAPRLENRVASAMPQFFADRFGWPEMVRTVAEVYSALPAEQRARTAVFATDVGQGGAIDYYGPRLGLPKAIGGHQNFWYWGPRGYDGDSVLVLGDRRQVLESKFEVVIPKAEIGHPYAMRQEHFTLFLCQKPKGWRISADWPLLKKWG